MSSITKQPLADTFFALGDKTRLSLISELRSGEALSATTLSRYTKATRQNTTKHLRVLEKGGLLTHKKIGREVLYSLEAKRLNEARAFLDDVSAGWDRAIERLRRIAET